MVQTLCPRSYEHSINCGYATLKVTQSSMPMGLQYLGPIATTLSQGTYVAGALG